MQFWRTSINYSRLLINLFRSINQSYQKPPWVNLWEYQDTSDITSKYNHVPNILEKFFTFIYLIHNSYKIHEIQVFGRYTIRSIINNNLHLPFKYATHIKCYVAWLHINVPYWTRTINEYLPDRVFISVRICSHWCAFQSQVAHWKKFVRFFKIIKRQKLGKIRENL